MTREFWLWIVLPLVGWAGPGDFFELPKVILLAVVVAWEIIIGVKKQEWKAGPIIKKAIGWWLVLLAGTLINGSDRVSWWGQPYRHQGLVLQLIYIVWAGLVAVRSNNKLIGWGGIGLAVTTLIFGNGGTTGHPAFAGGYLAMAWGFGGWWMAWPLVAAAVGATRSRGAILALAAVTVGRILMKTKNLMVRAVIILTVIAVVIAVYPQKQVSTFDRRETIWARGWKAVWQKPIFGWGAEGFEKAFRANLGEKDFDLKNIRVDRAHNEFLEIAVNSGLTGLAIYGWMLGSIGLKLWKNRNKSEAVAVFFGLIAYFTVAMVNVVNVNGQLFFWTMAGMADGLGKKDAGKSGNSGQQG